jgi:hypothetical protein
MRRLGSVLLVSLLTSIAAYTETGVPPRPDSSEYPAHRPLNNGGVMAAALLPADKVAAIFSSDVSKHYVVVEIALYPETGRSIDLQVLDFALKAGGDRSFPVTASEVAWRGKHPPNTSASGVAGHVVGEVGVGYGTRQNPATGRTERGLDTWAGVGVDNRPLSNPPNGTANSADRVYQLEGKLQTFELPEGVATRPVAGYLYFPASLKKARNSPLTVEYSRSGERTELSLPTR